MFSYFISCCHVIEAQLLDYDYDMEHKMELNVFFLGQVFHLFALSLLKQINLVVKNLVEIIHSSSAERGSIENHLLNIR
jgi:hypothetical protein